MRRGSTALAAAALAAAALAPAPAAAASLPEVEAQLSVLEERAAALERPALAPEEPGVSRARRRLEAGRRRSLAGEWRDAAVLLSDAVDEPSFRATPAGAEAVFLLAEALRRDGACGAARARYAEYLAGGARERRGEALAGALECAVRERRGPDVERLVAEAERAFAGAEPAEVRYLVARSLFDRTDLGRAERYERATAAFERVGPPLHLQARYFQGVLDVEEQDLPGAARRFEDCARASPADARQGEVKELCALALARVHAEMDEPAAAVVWYATIPWGSPRFAEATQELARAQVRAKDDGRALASASLVAELAPESAAAPQARLLAAHLLLRLGRLAEASEAYEEVIEAYAPARDALDALLAARGDPVPALDALAGRAPAGPHATVLPAAAVERATAARDVAVALALVESVREARREVSEAADAADRLDAQLELGGGLDALPALRRRHAEARALGNAAALLEGALADAAGAPGRASPAGPGGQPARGARAALEQRLAALPRTPQEAELGLARARARGDAAERAAHRLALLVQSCRAAIDGAEAALARPAPEDGPGPEVRREVAIELHRQRAFVATYEAELRSLRRDLARALAARDAQATSEESRLRASYLQAIERERSARGGDAPSLRGEGGARDEAARERLAAVRARAAAVEAATVAEAARRSAELRARVDVERSALAAHAEALDALEVAAKPVLGRIAARSLREVRDRLYRTVLEADVGRIDVAWTGKRRLLDAIQELSARKAAELEQLDRESAAVLREVE